MEEIDLNNIVDGGCCICGVVIDFVKVVEEYFVDDDEDEDDDDFQFLDEDIVMFGQMELLN